MQKKSKIIIFTAIFIIIAGFAGWYIYRDLNKANQEPVLIETENQNQEQASVAEPAGPDMAKAEEIKKQMPNLDREIVVKVSLPEDTKNKAIADIKLTIGEIRADYDRLEKWLDLGLLRKLIGDYEGAGEAWLFATIIRPKDPVAFHNLGDLYSQNLVDFSKAEKYYLAAVEKDTSHQPFFYTKLYEFYLYYLKKPDLAEKTLLEALKTNPSNEYLQSLLKDLQG